MGVLLGWGVVRGAQAVAGDADMLAGYGEGR